MRSFWTKIDALEAWHAKLVDKPWLQPLKPTKFVIALILLSTVIAAGMNWYVRHWQYQVWEQNPQIFYLDDGTPLFTTTDAPYFLGLAKNIKQGDTVSDFNKLQLYPSTKTQIEASAEQKNSLFDAPLLSIIIAAIADDNTERALLSAGNFLIPITAVVTSLMIVFAFGMTGFWLEGAVAAAGAGLSYAYMTRSAAGRIDTDQLNLGLFYFITGLVILTGRSKSFLWSMVLSCITGLSFLLFDWWYSQPIFGWFFLIGLFWLVFVDKRSIKQAFILCVVFVFFSGMWQNGWVTLSGNAYLTEVIDAGGLIFPNSLSTITETSKVSLSEVLIRISGSIWMGSISAIFLGFWFFYRPATAMVFAPALGFVVLNFVIGNRAIFYSSPMFWFGLGWGSLLLTRYISKYFVIEKIEKIGVSFTTALIFFLIWQFSATNYIQAPTFEKRIIEHFRALPSLVSTPNAVIITWWDYGYMSMFMNGFPTIHDGGNHTQPATHFVAKGLLDVSQERSAEMFKQLARHGSQGIISNAFDDPNKPNENHGDQNLLIVLTKDMANWMPSIAKIGNWDIINGKPKSLTGVPSDYQLTYEKLSCKAVGQAYKFICNGVAVDTKTGQFGNQTILDGMVVSRDGRQLSGQKFSNSNSSLMLHSEIGERARSNMLIHRDLYFSVFHQLFHTGRHDEQYFELVHDDYPTVRVFKVK